MNPKKTQEVRAYHHGDLRNALIVAAAELIEENGSAGFALVDAARKAGVSTAAPYRHFRDKEALLHSVVDFAFFSLAVELETSTRQHQRGSIEAIVALGQTYIRFLTTHPRLCNLMWSEVSTPLAQKIDNESRSSGFYLLVDTVRAWCENVDCSREDAVVVSTKLWAMAHGLSGIAMHGQLERFLPEADVYSLLESSTYTFLEGVQRECESPPRSPHQV
jgi:AcrR family transcriptional regulator